MSGAFVFRLFAWLFALALLALPVVGLLSGAFATDRWPLRHLELHAELEQVSADDVRGIVNEYAGKGFFALSLSDLRQALAQLPWVESVEVRKRWPDTVFVRLLEYQPYAIWNGTRLVSRSGRLFTVPDVDAIAGLPRLSGPDAEVADVVNFHARAARLLDAAGYAVAQTRLSPRGSWSLILEAGPEIVLGRQRKDERLQRFAATFPSLAGSQPNAWLKRADLRYPNGYALVWAESPGPADGSPGGARMPPLAAHAFGGAAHPIHSLPPARAAAGTHEDTDA